jgi:hypothetical protein
VYIKRFYDRDLNREVKCFNTIAGGEWLKIKFYLLGIAARPTEKLAAQIILFAFQTIFF